MRGVIPFITITFIAFLLKACNSVEPPTGLTINLKLEDVSCTEAWITLSSNLRLPATIELKQNNQNIKTINLTKSDSLLYIDSLLPNTSYTFVTYNNAYRVTSNQLQLTTLDTISHNFIWQTWTFGEHSSSVLNDIAVISEDNIWACGEIYMNDSLGQPDPQPYGLVHWNGSEWKVKRITAQNPTGGYSYIIPMGIFVVSPTEIWLARGGVYLFNGDSIAQAYWLINYPGYNGGIFNDGESASKLWGTSSEDLYTVGYKGALAHFNGIIWQKLESGTDIRLTDIYGTVEGKNLWTCGWDNNHAGGIILSIENSGMEVIWDGISVNGEYLNFINTLWTNGGEFWLAGGFVFRQSVLFQDKGHLVRILTETGSKLFDPGNFVLSIRGTGKNNIFLAGDLGMLWHFNGSSWHKYEELYSQQLDRKLYSVNAKDNIVVAVGWKNSNAWIVLGTK